MNNIIALISDFGTKDHYVGVMKGVILSINPLAKIIDITHGIAPQNIKEGAFALMSSFDYFPVNTIFLSIVDPGVGSERRCIAAKINERYYVGPDNGMLTYVLDYWDLKEAYEITEKKFFLPVVATTFHGRDVFAPAAAYVSKGAFINELGPLLSNDSLVRLPMPRSRLGKEGTRYGEIIYIDRFGNLVSTIKCDTLSLDIENKSGRSNLLLISIGEARINGLKKTYNDVLPGEFVAYIGSSGFIEIGIRNGNAADKLGAVIGMEVRAKIYDH